MGMVTKSSILESAILDAEPIVVPEWGGEVLVKALSAAEFDSFLSDVRDTKGEITQKGLVVKLLLLCLCDDSGNALFVAEDEPALARQPMKRLMPVFELAQRQNGINEEETEALLGN
ncbi:MAG: hypothetical protein ACE5FM_00095 [Methyloligellaceae bacterium]